MRINSLDLMKGALDATALRQEAISSNIANVNTDDYKVYRVAFEDQLTEALNGTALQKTHRDHIGIGNVEDLEPTITRWTNTSVKENGNNVDVDMEMANLAENSLHYQALISQVNAKYSQMKTVLTN